MENNMHPRRDSISKETVQSEERGMIQKISEVILDAREVMENKSEGEAGSVFERIAEIICDLSSRATVPKKDGTTLERRMAQFVSLAIEFEDNFSLALQSETLNSREVAMAKSALGIYRFGMQAQSVQVVSGSSHPTVPVDTPELAIYEAKKHKALQSIMDTQRRNKRQIEELSKELGIGASNSQPDSEESGRATKKRATRSSTSNATSSESQSTTVTTCTSATATTVDIPKATGGSTTIKIPGQGPPIRTTTTRNSKYTLTVKEFADGTVWESYNHPDIGKKGKKGLRFPLPILQKVKS